MNQKLSQIFKNIPEIEPHSHLEALIMQKIGLQRERQLRRKLVLSYAGLIGSGLAIFGAVFSLGDAVWQSEFWNLATLIFSDLRVVASNWQDFSYSLLETFPVISAVIILIPIFTLFLSLNAYLNNRHIDLKLRFN